MSEQLNWMPDEDPDDNATYGATGGIYRPDTRSEEERQRASRRYKRQMVNDRWKWRLRGLLPRGWGHNDCCECNR